MRRRRQQLQVSTFPFLAVLLCAMGVLILLLLVLDRRARVVARARLLQAAALAQTADAEAEAARRAEWERRRQALHAQLQEEDEQLLAQVRAIQDRAAAALANLDASQEHQRTLQDRLRQELAQLALGQEELQARRSAVDRVGQQTDTTRAELARLTTLLAQMEQTLAALAAARKRQQQTYSLVPYRGKRGDSRRPLYIECAANGLVFHPDRLALTGLEATASGIRGEIERRIARQREGVTRTGGTPDESAYLLMLIRPNGIVTYYQTIAALQGLKVDFGYELIDEDWLLDFPEDGHDPVRPQPWMVVEKTDPQTPGWPGGGRRPGGAEAASAQSAPGVGAPLGGGSALAGRSGPAPPTGPRGGPGAEWTIPGEPATGGPPRGVAPPPASAQAGTLGLPQALGGGPERGGLPGARAPRGIVGGMPAEPGGSPAPGSGDGPAGAGPAARPQLVLGTAAANAAGSGAPSLIPEMVPGQPRPPGQAATQAPETPAEVPTSGEPGQGATPGGGTAEPSVGSMPLPVADPTAKAGPRTTPAPPPVLRPSRDVVLAIECTGDALVLQPTGPRIPLASLPRGSGGDSPLVQAVHQAVARRQAAVRPGEAPPRVFLRFLVRPDGLRAYYLAYPALEPLRLPMSRENLEAGEAITPRVLGR